jgi:prepilin-type N-terminal cleavage/methylation domain-containing protein
MSQSHSQRRAGFTFIELLTVIVIIGLLAMLGITKFGDSKRRSHYATMKADLKRVATMAETVFSQDQSYANFTPPPGSQGVTLSFTPNGQGWTATASHTALPGVQCTLTAGPNIKSSTVCN